MATTNSITLTFGYDGTDFTRKYKFEDVEDEALSTVAEKVKAINASLAAGTDDGLGNFFLSDDGKPFNVILAAASDKVISEEIDLTGGE